MLRTLRTPRFRAQPHLLRTLATTSIPKTQKAIVVEEYGGKLNYRDIPVPEPGPNDILVNIKYSGVCNSDFHTWRAEWPLKAPLPVILGHEGAGVVVAKGSNVTNFEVGDLAGVKWINATCQTCEQCEDGWENLCGNQAISGFTVPGTYTLANAVQAAHLPKGCNLAEVAPLLCAGLTVYKGLKEAHLKAGQWVAIIGAGGGLGSLAVQYAKAMGYKVLGLDSSKKESFMKEKGVDATICFDKVDSVVEAALEITQGGPHGVINVSNSGPAYNDALKYVRTRGSVILIGIPKGDAKIESPIMTQILKGATIKGSTVGTRVDTREALQFYQEGKIKSPVQVIGLSEIERAFSDMEKGNILGRYVLDTSR